MSRDHRNKKFSSKESSKQQVARGHLALTEGTCTCEHEQIYLKFFFNLKKYIFCTMYNVQFKIHRFFSSKWIPS